MTTLRHDQARDIAEIAPRSRTTTLIMRRTSRTKYAGGVRITIK